MKLLINIHSFVDVITNSSTELFVTNVNQQLNSIKDALISLIKMYNNDVDNGKFDEYTKKAIIGDFNVYIYTREKYNKDKKLIDDYRKRGIDLTVWGYEHEENIGKIIIEGTCDNSIPFEMFSMILNTFNASGYHLG